MSKQVMIPIKFTFEEGGQWVPAQVNPLDLFTSFDTGQIPVFRHDHYSYFYWQTVKPAAILLPCGHLIYDFILKKHGENPVCFAKKTLDFPGSLCYNG